LRYRPVRRAIRQSRAWLMRSGTCVEIWRTFYSCKHLYITRSRRRLYNSPTQRSRRVSVSGWYRRKKALLFLKVAPSPRPTAGATGTPLILLYAFGLKRPGAASVARGGRVLRRAGRHLCNCRNHRWLLNRSVNILFLNAVSQPRHTSPCN
jgi:hypothetical protein